MTDPSFSWSGLAELATSALLGCVGGVFAAGRFFGAATSRAEATTKRVDTHDARIEAHSERIRAVETDVAVTKESVLWIREALRTGRDPQTNQPLGR